MRIIIYYIRSFDLSQDFRPNFIYNSSMAYVEIIKQIMIDRGMSQQTFADILGVNQTTVGQWLLGKKKPGYDSIMMLYEKFDIEPNLLFGIDK